LSLATLKKNGVPHFGTNRFSVSMYLPSVKKTGLKLVLNASALTAADFGAVTLADK